MKSPRLSHLFPLLIVLVLAGFVEESFFSARARADVAPMLGIRVEGGNQVRLAWRSSAAGFGLEQSLSLNSPANWHTVAASPALEGGEWVVRLPFSDQTRFFRLRSTVTPLTTISATSPTSGESGVAVTRETVLRFSAPLAANTQITTDQLYAEFGGRKYLSRVELSSDRRTATLFYLEPLSGSARMRVTLKGDAILDPQGRAVDADGDGQPGGTALIEFTTLSLSVVLNTAVVGKVFASEIGVGADGRPINRPLAGAIITLDGKEQEVRATTAADGSLTLRPVPAGEFFVHIDERTAAGSRYPNGASALTVS